MTADDLFFALLAHRSIRRLAEDSAALQAPLRERGFLA
jgi:hypothetical protein